MADYFQVKNQNIFNPPANTSLGNATNQFNDVYVQNDLVLGNVTVTGTTIIAPRVTTITYPGDDTAADTAGGQTITLTGTGFVAGASVLINGSAVGVVSVVSSTTITFVSPANATGSYVIYVVNPDGSTAIAIPGIQYSGTPTWTTAAGTLGNVYETASFNQTVTATGDAPITYSVVSGSLPPGSTFNANGTITGTSQLSASPTTYSFTVRATDAEQQDTNRAFSIAVIPDVVTWSSPTANATYTPAANVAIANITLSATSAVGSGITYSANTLPTGLSLTGANISGTPTVVANTSSLLTATANTTTESSSITINWVVSVASDPYFMYNSLLLPGTGTNGAQNNTFLDGSTNNFTITRNGNTTQGTFSPYGSNWSNYFDGSSKFTIAGSTAFGFGTGDFTIELWVFCSFNGAIQEFIDARPSDIGTPWVFGINAAGLARTYDGTTLRTGGQLTANAWNHVAWARASNVNTIYVNGVSGHTWTASQDFGSSRSLTIANNVGPTSEPLTGYISNLRMVKGTAVYTSAFTPSTTPLTAISGTSLLTCQSNCFIDNSSNAFAITLNGTPTIQRFSPFSPTAAYSTSTIGGSGYFDGTGDYLSLASNAAFTVGTGNLTIEAWIYCTSLTQPYQGILSGRVATPTEYPGLGLTIDNGQLIFSIMNAVSSGLRDTVTVPLNQWVHVVGVRSGTNAALFVNGVRKAFSASNSENGTSSAMGLGRYYPATDNYYFSGYISNARLVKGTAVYDPTLSTLTVPTSPLTAISGTSLLTNFTNAGIIDNTMINNLETVGNAQISTAQSKFGGGSMYFDGTGDYLTMSNNPNINLDSGNFTIEMWLYPTGDTQNFSLFAKAGSFELKCDTNRWVWQILPSTNVFVTNGNLAPANTWKHVALVRNGATTTVYIDGTAYTQGTSANAVTNTNPLTIGAGAGGTYTGYINDFRFTKGYARYTATFTPATSAFPTY